MRTATIAWVAVGVAGAALAGTALAPRLGVLLGGGDAFAACRGGQVAGGDIGGPFTLVAADGREVTDREVLAAPSLLYFGYASCPDVCPLDTVRNAEAAEILAGRGIEATPVFVTVDPARDTPEVMGEFAAGVGGGTVGLSGSEAQVRAAADAYRVYYARAAGEAGADPEFYLMDHSAYTYLTLPGVGFVDFVGRDAPPEEVADRLQCFVEAAA